MPKALITGITGQDGSYLAELLLSKGYTVHGIVRRCSHRNTPRIDHIYQDPREPDCNLFLHFADITEKPRLQRILAEVQPDEVYNLAAQSHVLVSFLQPDYTRATIYNGTVNLLEAMRDIGLRAKFYQASSSEMFGNSPPMQDEYTKFSPCSPYAVAKVDAFNAVREYRDRYGLFACNGILMNHESPRRGENFVTRKITLAVSRIKCGLQDVLYLGNLEAKRDWGFARDYVDAMWLMLQADQPDDYVVATGESHSVQEFLELVFGFAELDWREYVKFDERHTRPAEVNHLCGNARKAHEKLGWKPTVRFAELARMMFDADMKLAQNERLIRESERA